MGQVHEHRPRAGEPHEVQGVRPTRPGRRGFTLVELIIVIAVLTLLGSFLAVYLLSSLEHTRRQNAEAMVRQISQACAAYRLDFGAYPPSARSLRRCLGTERRVRVQKDAAGGVEVRKPPLLEFPTAWLGEQDSIVDPWGNELRYQAPGRRPPSGVDLWSAGRNGRDELAPAHPDFDDVATWSLR